MYIVLAGFQMTFFFPPDFQIPLGNIVNFTAIFLLLLYYANLIRFFQKIVPVIVCLQSLEEKLVFASKKWSILKEIINFGTTRLFGFQK